MFGFIKKGSKKTADNAGAEQKTQSETEKKLKTYDDEYGFDDYDDINPIDDFDDGGDR